MSRTFQRTSVTALSQKIKFPRAEFSLLQGKDISLLKISQDRHPENYYICDNVNILRGHSIATYVFHKFDFSSEDPIVVNAANSIILKLDNRDSPGEPLLTPDMGRHIRSGFWEGTREVHELFPYLSHYIEGGDQVNLRGGYFKISCQIDDKYSLPFSRDAFIMPNLGGSPLVGAIPILNAAQQKMIPHASGMATSARSVSSISMHESSVVEEASLMTDSFITTQTPRFSLVERLSLILEYLRGVHSIYSKLTKNFSSSDISAAQVFLDSKGYIRLIHPQNALLHKLYNCSLIPGGAVPRLDKLDVLVEVIAILLGNEHYNPRYRLKHDEFHQYLINFPKLERGDHVDLNIIVQLFLKKMLDCKEVTQLPFVMIEDFFKVLHIVVTLINRVNTQQQPHIDNVESDDDTPVSVSHSSISSERKLVETNEQIERNILHLLSSLFGRVMWPQDNNFFLTLTQSTVEIKLARVEQVKILMTMVTAPYKLRYLLSLSQYDVLKTLVTLEQVQSLLTYLLQEAQPVGGLYEYAQIFVGLQKVNSLTDNAINMIESNSILKKHIVKLCNVLLHDELLTNYDYDLSWFTDSYVELTKRAGSGFAKQLIPFLIKYENAAYLLEKAPGEQLSTDLQFKIYRWLTGEMKAAEQLREEIHRIKRIVADFTQNTAGKALSFLKYNTAKDLLATPRQTLIDQKTSEVTEPEILSYIQTHEGVSKEDYIKQLVDEGCKAAENCIRTVEQNSEQESKKEFAEFIQIRALQEQLSQFCESATYDLFGYFSSVYMNHCKAQLGELIMRQLRPRIVDAYGSMSFFSTNKSKRDKELAQGPGSRPDVAALPASTLQATLEHAGRHGDQCLWTQEFTKLGWSPR